MSVPLLEAVRGLRVADPGLGVKQMLAKLREQQPDLEAGSKEVREALTALEAESEAKVTASSESVQRAQEPRQTRPTSPQDAKVDVGELRLDLGLEIEAYLLQAMRAQHGEPDSAIMEWVDERVDPAVPNAKLAGLMMRSLLVATCASKAGLTSRKLHAAIKVRTMLLRRFLHVGTMPEQMALQCSGLYEVQAYCARQDWPRNLMRDVFYQLYEADVILEEAFGVWREDTTDESADKMKALIQVNEFLQWLETTEEEAESGED